MDDDNDDDSEECQLQASACRVDGGAIGLNNAHAGLAKTNAATAES